MIFFFKTPQNSVIATESDHQLTQDETKELCWLYGNAELQHVEKMDGYFVGPRRGDPVVNQCRRDYPEHGTERHTAY